MIAFTRRPRPPSQAERRSAAAIGFDLRSTGAINRGHNNAGLERLVRDEFAEYVLERLPPNFATTEDKDALEILDLA